MSTYLSYRRRFSDLEKHERRLSEPEKPEPRFQWRLRVQSLMMDDSEKAPSLSDKRSHRFDSRRALARGDARLNDTVTDAGEDADTCETHRDRRDRFMRTKSDSHLRLRVRFSKVLDTQSLDDEDYMVESHLNYRRLRSSQESLDSSGDSQSRESFDQPARSRSHSKTPDEGTSQQPEDADDEGGAVGGSGDTSDTAYTDDDVKDVSKGAIPKRYPNMNSPKRGRSKESEDEEKLKHDEKAGEPPSVLTSERDTTSIPMRKEEKSHEGSLEETLSPKEKKGISVSAVAEDQAELKSALSQHETVLSSESKELLVGAAALSGNPELAEDGENVESRPASEEKDQIDDIDAIIERIIAEEEAMLEGKESSTSLVKPSSEHLDNEDMAKLTNEMKTLQHSIDKCEENVENGIDIMPNDTQTKRRASSLPSYQSDFDQDIMKTVVPYSSSCPFSKIQMKSGNDANNVDDDDAEDDDGWAYLPVILLEDVFTLLTPKERHQASQVCRQWYDLFYSPRVWETFILLERTLTKKRFNLYKGYQRELCPGKTQLCFRRVGSFFKRIVVTPITDYFNLYEFLRILAAFLQYQEDHGLTAMPLLHTFDFTFACASRGDGEIMVHGTGGQILEMIKQLLIRMSTLKHLKLNQLLIDVMEVSGLFEAIANCFGECLHSLEMMNVTKVPYALTDLARFRNLIKLAISPQHLSEEVLLLLAGLNLLQLHLLQDPYTCECEPVSYEAWKLMREMAPWLHVYLEVIGNTRAKLLIQPRAPVHGVFLRTPYTVLTNDLVMSLVEHYSKTLRYFVQERLPRVHGPRGFESRCDSNLLFLVRRCRVLHTVVVRERISTATLILVATEGCLSTLLVRQNGLVKRCDWPQCGEWTKEFYSRLRKNSLDYNRCTDEVCTLLRRRWKPLTDKQFMRLKIVPRCEMF